MRKCVCDVFYGFKVIFLYQCFLNTLEYFAFRFVSKDLYIKYLPDLYIHTHTHTYGIMSLDRLIDFVSYLT